MSLIIIDKNEYGNVFSDLIKFERVNELGPGKENIALLDKIQSVNLDTAFDTKKVSDKNSAEACISAIWLLHDFLDKSHQISQSIPTPTGSFWHGIMHRREGDYWNSKYWFRQVGNHSIFSPLYSEVKQLLNSEDVNGLKILIQQNTWDPFLFVDLVQEYIGTGGKEEVTLKQVQLLEWQLLFDYCYNRAV
jgi:hypothetical protein